MMTNKKALLSLIAGEFANSKAELESNCKREGLSVQDVRDTLCLLIIVQDEDLLRDDIIDRLSPFCTFLNLKNTKLKSIALNKKAPIKQREGALTSILKSSPMVFQLLDDFECVQLCGPWVRPMLNLYPPTELYPSMALIELYNSTAKEAQELLLTTIADFARQSGNYYHAKPLFDTLGLDVETYLEAH